MKWKEYYQKSQFHSAIQQLDVLKQESGERILQEALFSHPIPYSWKEQ